MNASLSLVTADAGAAARRTGLWLLMGVIAMLFFLFSAAYVMRMGLPDWRPLSFVPWQLWLSTALLALASVAWERAWRAAAGGRAGLSWRAHGLACACSLAFLASQLWAWQAMVEAHFAIGANPANSFFYLITGLHGLHVLGGLVVAAWAGARGAAMQLCARYWHFLLGLWLVMFGLLFHLTPELVQQICGGT
jgi:cytochrome c oxidase subunit 3